MTRAYIDTSGIVLLAGDEPFEYDPDGVRWQWNGSEPWSPGPAPKAVTGDNANDHGSWDATEFYGPRRYPLEGLAHAPDHDALHKAKHRFMTAMNLGFDLRCVEPGFDRVGRFRRDGEPSWTELSHRVARFSVPLWAGDPRAYGRITYTADTAFPSSSGGLEWPATWSTMWDATTATGLLQLPNYGNTIAWPTFIINGPVTEPKIINADTGESMNFDIALTEGQSLHVDTATHQVLANGEAAASRRTTFYGTWFGLRPGLNNIRFDGSAAGPGARLFSIHRHTWI